jgi:heme exporter protein D
MKKSTLIPLVLLAYLAVMSYIGYPAYASGEYTPFYYFGIIGVTLCVIVLLHFSMKRRERLRDERERDTRRHDA